VISKDEWEKRLDDIKIDQKYLSLFFELVIAPLFFGLLNFQAAKQIDNELLGYRRSQRSRREV
jgi:hypothetical protein